MNQYVGVRFANGLHGCLFAHRLLGQLNCTDRMKRPTICFRVFHKQPSGPAETKAHQQHITASCFDAQSGPQGWEKLSRQGARFFARGHMPGKSSATPQGPSLIHIRRCRRTYAFSSRLLSAHHTNITNNHHDF